MYFIDDDFTLLSISGNISFINDILRNKITIENYVNLSTIQVNVTFNDNLNYPISIENETMQKFGFFIENKHAFVKFPL